MKRLLTFLLAIIICASALAACGNTQTGDSNSPNAAGEITVEEQTILDDQGIKAVVKGYDKFENELLSYDRALLIEVTNSTDKNITFGLSQLSVNGYMLEAYYSVTVEAGKTETYPVVFNESALESLGVTTIADYEFRIAVDDEETLESLIESDPVSIKTSAYEGYEYKFDESGTVLYDADGIKIVAKDLTEDEYFGACARFYVANGTDKAIGVTIKSCSVNGKDVEDVAFGSELSAGKHSIDLLSFGEEERPKKIESLTLSFSIYDWDTGDTIVEKTEPATVTY